MKKHQQIPSRSKYPIILGATALLLAAIATVMVFKFPKTPQQPVLSENSSEDTSPDSLSVSEIESEFTSSEISSSVSTIVSSAIPKSKDEVVIPEAEDITQKIQKTNNVAKVLHEESVTTKQTEENTVKVSTGSIDFSGLSKKYVKIPVAYLPQNPELPTGCEITALTAVLNYYGFPVSKMTLASSNYLKQSDGRANFWEVFVGHPDSKYGCGCYAKPIVEAANKYLREQNSAYVAKNVSNSSFEYLLKTVESGIPVIIWGTEQMKPAYVSKVWNIDGKRLELLVPEHCLVLIGYDLNTQKAIMNDPLRGIVTYDLETVKKRYISLHSQAVIVIDTTPKAPENSESSVISETSDSSQPESATESESSSQTSDPIEESTTVSSGESSTESTPENTSSENTTTEYPPE